VADYFHGRLGWKSIYADKYEMFCVEGALEKKVVRTGGVIAIVVMTVGGTVMMTTMTTMMMIRMMIMVTMAGGARGNY